MALLYVKCGKGHKTMKNVVGSHAANRKWCLEHLEAVVKFCPLGCDAEIAGFSKTLINFYQTAHPTKHYLHSDGREGDDHQAKYKWRYILSWRMMVKCLIWADDSFSGLRGGGVFNPPKIPKALQNRAKLNPIVKTVKNC